MNPPTIGARPQAAALTRAWFAAAFLLAAVTAAHTAQQPKAPQGNGISRAASDRCAAKLKQLEAFEAAPASRKNQETRFTQEEINSYLALELSSKYHPSLKSLVMTFEEDNKLRGVAAIDFDELSMRAKGGVTRLLAQLLSGTHTMTMRGTLVTRDGKANFALQDAYFDEMSLPNFLVEQIISSVGAKQKPPFDPLQPSRMPYKIDHVDVHSGYIVVHQ